MGHGRILEVKQLLVLLDAVQEAFLEEVQVFYVNERVAHWVQLHFLVLLLQDSFYTGTNTHLFNGSEVEA